MLVAIAVVVDVEASREAEARVQHERSHERSGPVPGVLQDRRQRRQFRSETKQSIRAHAVNGRRHRGEHRRVGRKRERRGRVRARQHEPAGRETIQRRREVRGPAERADAIGAQRVDGDEQEVAARACAGLDRRLHRAAPDQPAGERHKSDRREKELLPHPQRGATRRPRTRAPGMRMPTLASFGFEPGGTRYSISSSFDSRSARRSSAAWYDAAA